MHAPSHGHDGASDLIDFGSSEPATRPQQPPAAAATAPKSVPGGQTGDLLGLDSSSVSTSIQPTEQPPVKRMDTETNELDEFVDAPQ
jgi:hypothetical protein